MKRTARPTQALFFASTHHHLVMCQATAELVRDNHRGLVFLWFGKQPLSELSDFTLLDGPDVVWVDLHHPDYPRFKLAHPGGRALLASMADRLERRLVPHLSGPLHVYLTNDSQLFPQAALDRCTAEPFEETLVEEGLGFYLGTRGIRKHLERMITNVALRMKGHRYREVHRDFSLNKRFHRFACNYPGFLRREGATVLDTRDTYRALMNRAAGRLRDRLNRDASRYPEVECLYVSSNYSEARMMSRADEYRLLEDIHEAATSRLAPVVHISFHPNENEDKRRVARDIGFVEVSHVGPFELYYLARPCRHVLSLRSSVLINLPILRPELSEGFWIVSSDRPAVRKLHSGATSQLFSHVQDIYPSLQGFEIDHHGLRRS